MITKKMETELNQQINKELYSSYLYLAMSSYVITIGFCGFGHWLCQQSKEELAHAVKIIKYMQNRGANIVFTTIEQPSNQWISLIDVFESTLKHEQYITSSICHLINVAIEEKDFATINFLNWYMEEQIEEEAQAECILQKLKYAENDKAAVLMMNEKLSKRD